jgi:uncharacterized membrane protein YebE (DUF533 family)
MAGFTDILGSIINQGMSPTRTARVSHGLGGRGGDLGAVLDNIGQVLGQNMSEPPREMPRPSAPPSRPASHAPSGGGLGDILGSLAGNKAVLGGLGALAAAILGSKSGGGRRGSRKSVGGGLLAMLASLAVAALQNSGRSPARLPRALMDVRTPEDEEALEQEAEIIVRAMISAAKADGRVDETEMDNILGRLAEDGLTDEEKEFLRAEMRRPLDINEVIGSAQGRPELAAQIYAASLLAIEVDTPAEQQYLRDLARGLDLDPEVTTHIERSLGMA